jgi:hypothetical protein
MESRDKPQIFHQRFKQRKSSDREGISQESQKLAAGLE